LGSAKQFCEVDLVKTQLFSFKLFLINFLMLSSTNGISRSAKQFCEVDIDLLGQNATFFFKAFFDKTIDVFVKKRHFAKC
jgi:hypothetical protein